MAEVLMNLADSLAQRSECSKLKVGCVLATPDLRHIVGNGYNGGPKNSKYVCTETECKCLHAEDNAVGDIIGQFPEKVAFITTFPCWACVTRLINNGVRKIYYRNEYKDGSHHLEDLPAIKEELNNQNIMVIKI